jgi:SAM-dependent methyltransferase
MKIERGSELYQKLYDLLARPPSSKKERYIHRYLEVKQIDWHLWGELSGNVLDVGSYIPLDAVILSQMSDIQHIYLVDLRPLPFTIMPDKATFLQCDATRLAFPEGAFDVVMSFSAVEHLPDPALQRRWIAEMVRVTKPGGQLLITVDNAWSWLNRIWDRYHQPIRRLTPPELREWVLQAGDVTIEAKTSGALYYWGFRPRVRGSARLAYFLDRALNPLSQLFPMLGNRIGYRFRKH